MKIVTVVKINKSDKENLKANYDEVIRREIAIKMATDVLSKQDTFFYELDLSTKEENDLRYYMELIVFDKNSFKDKLHKLQDKLDIPDQVMKELWNDLLMNY
jgi:hypothetical protein